MENAEAASAEETDRGRLKAEIAALGGSEDEAEAVERLLRARRRQLAKDADEATLPMRLRPPA